MNNLTKGRKVFKTVCLIFIWICIGLNLEITGPTFIDLKIITNTNYEEVSRALSGRAFGFFVGSATGGFLVEKLDSFCDLILACSLDIIGICGILIPYLTSTSWMFFVILFQGICEGVINIAGQKTVLEIWQENSASPMNTIHLGFGIGSLIVPQIAEPFLSTLNTAIQNVTNTSLPNDTLTVDTGRTTQFFTKLYSVPINSSQFSHSNMTASSSKLSVRHSSVKWPYLIVAIVAFTVSFVFYMFQFKGKSFRNRNNRDKSKQEYKRSTFLKVIDPKTCSEESRFYGIAIFSLLFLLCFQSFGGLYICGKFIRSYAVDAFFMKSEESSWLNTCYWISFSFGSFLGFISGRWIPIRMLLLIDCTGIFISTILTAVYGQSTKLHLWIFSQFVGAFNALCFPLPIIWGDHHIKITGFALTVIFFGGSLGGIVYLWIVGNMYDTMGPQAFPYSCVVFGGLMFVLSILLHLASMKRGSRFQKSYEPTNTEELEMQ